MQELKWLTKLNKEQVQIWTSQTLCLSNQVKESREVTWEGLSPNLVSRCCFNNLHRWGRLVVVATCNIIVSVPIPPSHTQAHTQPCILNLIRLHCNTPSGIQQVKSSCVCAGECIFHPAARVHVCVCLCVWIRKKTCTVQLLQDDSASFSPHGNTACLLALS